LGLYLTAVVVVLLAPVSYAQIVGWITERVHALIGGAPFGAGWIEFSANIAIFVPLGFLLTALFRRHWLGVVIALTMSAAAEGIQGLIPSREASVRDIVANTLGAALGAFVAWMIIGARERSRSGPTDPEAP